MYRTYGDRVGFLFVYIQEAHPSDEWQMDSNVEQGIVFAQPTSYGERRAVAESCSGALQLSMPCVVDDMENSVDTAYAAWPERLYVIDVDRTIAYASAPGPWGFKPEEVAAWLRARFGQSE